MGADLLPPIETEQFETELSAEPWRVLRSETTKELNVRDILLRQGLEAFVPTGQVRKQRSDRFITVSTPLFPGYCFARYDNESFDFIGVIPWCYGTVRFADRDALIEDEEMTRVKAITAFPQKLDVLDHLVRGNEVNIVAGPLAGQRAIFISLAGVDYVCCHITLFGKSVAARIERYMVEPIKPDEYNLHRVATTKALASRGVASPSIPATFKAVR